MKKLLIAVGALILLGLSVFYGLLPISGDRKRNVVIAHAPYEISTEAQALHDRLMVADLHADTLLWMRDPLKRHKRGHVDVPRLQQGGVALQIFSAVTKAPKHLNYEKNTADSDVITMLVQSQRWPFATWGSLYERARYQAHRLQKAAARSDGNLQLVLTQSDLQSLIADHQNGGDRVGGILAIEGAHPLEGDLANVRNLYDAGYRVMGLQHFFDNELGGSLHGVSGAGLTPFGVEAIAEMERLHITIDVAHSSEQVVRDVLALTDRPLIVSHGGFKGVCDVKRNIDEELIKQIAERGGLIGVGYWQQVTCDDSPQGIANVIVYGVGLVGADHVALGSDFDGAITTRLDTSELAAITQALLDRGLDEETIEKIMGGNVLRFFAANLPQ